MKHRLDPTHLHHAATRLGTIVAEGQMSDADASDTIVSFLEACAGVSKSGLQMRLHHVMRDQAQAHRIRRENARTAIKWAVRPLIEAGADKSVIEEAAGTANGDVLTWEEIVPILRSEWDAAHNRRGRR